MTKKFRVWLDSGANHQSCRNEEVSLEYLGISDEDWEEMTEKEQEDVMHDVAFEQSDWGFTEIEEK